MALKHWILGGALALLCAGPAAAASYRFQQVVLEDKNGFKGPIPAFSMLLPLEWAWQGGVVWGEHGYDCSLNSISVHLEAVSPDRRQALYIRPGLAWVGSDSSSLQFPGADARCPIKPVLDPRQALDALYVQRYRPGAQVIGYRDAPDVVAISGISDQVYDFGGGMRTTQQVRAGELHLGFNVGGVNYEELVRGVVIYQRTDTAAQYGLPAMSNSTQIMLPMMVYRAPAGALDVRLVDLVSRSSKPVPVWQRAYNEHVQTMNRIAADGIRKRSEISAQTNAEISEIINSGYERRTVIMDRMAENTANAILERGRYADPSTGQEVFLPYHYSSYWRAQDGSYIVSDDANFDPYRDLGINAQRLEATR